MPRRTPKPLSSRDVRRFLHRERLQNTERRRNNDLLTTPHSIFTDTSTTPDTEPRDTLHNSIHHQVNRSINFETENMDEADMEVQTKSTATQVNTSRKLAQVTPISPWDGYLQEFPNSLVFNHRTIKTITYNVTDTDVNKVSIKMTALNAPYTGMVLTWLPYCKNRYEYYTVLGCKYKITVYPNKGTPELQWHLFVEFDAGNDVIPVEDLVTPTGNTLTSADYQLMGIYPKAELNHAYTTGSLYVNDYDNRAVVKGLYKPRDFKKNIVDDDNAQLWTQATTDPVLDERLNIFVCRTPASIQNDNTTKTAEMIIQIELEYLAQWKDSKDTYQYQRRGATEFY